MEFRQPNSNSHRAQKGERTLRRARRNGSYGQFERVVFEVFGQRPPCFETAFLDFLAIARPFQVDSEVLVHCRAELGLDCYARLVWKSCDGIVVILLDEVPLRFYREPPRDLCPAQHRVPDAGSRIFQQAMVGQRNSRLVI